MSSERVVQKDRPEVRFFTHKSFRSVARNLKDADFDLIEKRKELVEAMEVVLEQEPNFLLFLEAF